ncbi:MAG: cyclic nucleotide-binding domain-containing protein [Streptosporangiales bacterium]|nr:cyclic nucleotide-binding domain-containing protein [Streptosporangiales bacterium]MBO0891860.1 cyclic nucleotide-binding domain-containing protein [Acidothermales bacterium]
MTERLPCDVDELRTLFLFEKLSDEQLAWLCQRGHVETHEPGVVVAEGEPATCFYVLLDGKIALSRRVGGQEVETTRTDQRGAYAGAWTAFLEDGSTSTYGATVRALAPTRFYTLGAEDFAELMRQWFPMALHLLEGVFYGNRRTQQVIGQREQLLALGSLSAGLTHELNNPAAAAVRAASSLRDRVAGMRHKLAMIAGGDWDRRRLAPLIELQERAVEQVAKAPELTPLEASDREDELVEWFDDHGISGGYEIAPTFVQAGLDVAWLDQVLLLVDDGMLEGAVRWLNYTIESELLMAEIEDATTRISTLVGAAKQYSQMDRSPHQVLDVHELLDSTLVMMSRKIGDVRVVKEYDRTLPRIPVYGAELNQVWTNLVDNALQAMDGAGTLTIRTSLVGDRVQVEIADTGPGIPEDVVGRIFDPFFTTKPVGEGTGLGLDISWRIVVKKHHGDLTVESRPGDTRFRVLLPLRDGAGADAAAGPPPLPPPAPSSPAR